MFQTSFLAALASSFPRKLSRSCQDWKNWYNDLLVVSLVDQVFHFNLVLLINDFWSSSRLAKFTFLSVTKKKAISNVLLGVQYDNIGNGSNASLDHFHGRIYASFSTQGLKKFLLFCVNFYVVSEWILETIPSSWGLDTESCIEVEHCALVLDATRILSMFLPSASTSGNVRHVECELMSHWSKGNSAEEESFPIFQCNQFIIL